MNSLKITIEEKLPLYNLSSSSSPQTPTPIPRWSRPTLFLLWTLQFLISAGCAYFDRALFVLEISYGTNLKASLFLLKFLLETLVLTVLIYEIREYGLHSLTAPLYQRLQKIKVGAILLGPLLTLGMGMLVEGRNIEELYYAGFWIVLSVPFVEGGVYGLQMRKEMLDVDVEWEEAESLTLVDEESGWRREEKRREIVGFET